MILIGKGVSLPPIDENCGVISKGLFGAYRPINSDDVVTTGYVTYIAPVLIDIVQTMMIKLNDNIRAVIVTYKFTEKTPNKFCQLGLVKRGKVLFETKLEEYIKRLHNSGLPLDNTEYSVRTYLESVSGKMITFNVINRETPD